MFGSTTKGPSGDRVATTIYSKILEREAASVRPVSELYEEHLEEYMVQVHKRKPMPSMLEIAWRRRLLVAAKADDGLGSVDGRQGEQVAIIPPPFDKTTGGAEALLASESSDSLQRPGTS